MSTTTTTLQQPPTTSIPSISDPLSPTHWTTPQELTLLKSLTTTKPIGIHKHFRMLAIHSALLTSNTIPRPHSEHPHASTTAGIWRKLESLYDLKALDEREDAVFADVGGEDGDGDGDEEDEAEMKMETGTETEAVEYWREFELPGEEFEAKMWERRLAGEGHEEGGWSDGGDDDGDGDDAVDKEQQQQQRRGSTVVEDSEDPRSSPVDAGSVRGTRSSGRRVAAGRRLAEVKQEGSVRGGSRRTSKAASPSVVEEDTEMQDAADGQDENEEDSDEEDGDSDAGDTTEDDRKSTKATRGRGGRRGGARGRRGRRGK